MYYTVEDFGRRLKELRIKKRYRGHSLSRTLDKSSTYIYKVERGEEEMTVKEFLKVCELMGVPPKAFFDEENGDIVIEHEELLRKTGELPDRVRKFIKIWLR